MISSKLLDMNMYLNSIFLGVHLDYLTGDSRLNPSTLPQPPKETSVLVNRYLMRSQDELMPLAFTSPPKES